jgi:hypothetical protein
VVEGLHCPQKGDIHLFLDLLLQGSRLFSRLDWSARVYKGDIHLFLDLLLLLFLQGSRICSRLDWSARGAGGMVDWNEQTDRK